MGTEEPHWMTGAEFAETMCISRNQLYKLTSKRMVQTRSLNGKHVQFLRPPEWFTEG